jgi:hypothetical protein
MSLKSFAESLLLYYKLDDSAKPSKSSSVIPRTIQQPSNSLNPSNNFPSTPSPHQIIPRVIRSTKATGFHISLQNSNKEFEKLRQNKNSVWTFSQMS